MTVFMLIFININEISIYLKLISNKIIEQKGAKAVYINPEKNINLRNLYI